MSASGTLDPVGISMRLRVVIGDSSYSIADFKAMGVDALDQLRAQVQDLDACVYALLTGIMLEKRMSERLT